MSLTGRKFKNALIIKPQYALRHKVGSGGLDEKILSKAERIIENNTLDFAPLAEQYLLSLEKQISKIQENIYQSDAQGIAAILVPVLQLKGQGTMFKYPLITKVCNLLIDFLHDIKSTDINVMQVINAHNMTLKAITARKITGNGGSQGKALIQALDQACKHYFQVISKQSINT